jgi:ATP-dependent Clp protease protease subunit
MLPEHDEPEHKPAEITPSAALTEAVRALLFKSRTIIISGEVDQALASHIVGQLLALDVESHEPITMFINSQGGHVESGDTIHDVVKFIKSPVRMVGTGWVASIAAVIYVAVPRERRYSLPNTRFLLHQPSGGVRGHATDIDIEAREILAMRQRLNQLMARETGQTIEKIQEDTRRNFWLSAEAAKEYGLVGKIIQTADEVE